jgi:hypothetical protein
MIKRIALVIGGIAAAGVLALGLAAAGFGPVATDADQVGTQPLAAADPQTADPAVRSQTETVYVRPPAAPRVIHITKKAPAVKAATTRHATSATRHRDDEGEGRERGGEDD